jgi:hypothetical protein
MVLVKDPGEYRRILASAPPTRAAGPARVKSGRDPIGGLNLAGDLG